MKVKNTTIVGAKFPTRGKLIDFFIKIVEIENTNGSDRKRYQRFILEESISIEEYNETLDIYIDRILDELIVHKSKIGSAKNTIEEFLKLYLNIIQNIEVYAFTQECINAILIERIYVPFLIFFNTHYLSVNLNVFSLKVHPLETIFNMVKRQLDMNTQGFKKYLFDELNKITDKSKSDKTLIQSIQNWIDNKNFPDMQNIEYMSSISSNVLPQSKDTLKQYFIVAKLIDKSNISKEIILNPSLTMSSEKELEKFILKCVPQYQSMRGLAIELYNLTYIHKEKTEEMKDQFEKVYLQLKAKGFDENNMPYIAWTKARFHAQKNELQEAVKYYEKALLYGKNSMGKHYVYIVKEGLIVSAQTTRKNILDLESSKSSFTKFYKEAYFTKYIDSLPNEIKQYFLNDMKKKFSSYFTKLYPDTKINKPTKAYEQGIIFTPDFEKIKLDFKTPNKLIKNKYPNPMTQLMHCAVIVDYENVKKLLVVGADANATRFNDNGTALTMVLSNEFSEEKRENTIKIAKLLISKMSKDALDAKLPKKKMTALAFAIDLGYVEIVKSLIDKRVDINQIITFEKVSPLYYTLKKIGEAKMDFDTTLNAMSLSSEQDILKIVNTMPSSAPFLKNAITDQEKIKAFKKQQKYLNSNTLHREIGENISQFFTERSKMHIEEYHQIFDLLLEANPNLEIRLNDNMNTVLMLATELNEVELVKKLLAAGADKGATIDDSYNPKIKHTARAFARQNKNKELMELL